MKSSSKLAHKMCNYLISFISATYNKSFVVFDTHPPSKKLYGEEEIGLPITIHKMERILICFLIQSVIFFYSFKRGVRGEIFAAGGVE